MKITKTKRFQNGRFNYSIEYIQYQWPVVDEVTGEKSKQLMHHEIVKYYEFPFTFGKGVQFGACDDTGDYYRQ